MPITITSQEQADELRRENDEITRRLNLAKRHMSRIEKSLQPYRDRQAEIQTAFFSIYYQNRSIVTAE